MKKRLGIIGYGGQGAWHAGWANKSDVIELAGIYDINEKRCALARENGIKVYSSREEMLKDPTVDMVLCATPNGSHKEIVIAAAEAKKHVICEKPVAMSVADFDEMREAAQRCGVVFSVHQNRRWDLDYLAMKQLIETKEIGEFRRTGEHIDPTAVEWSTIGAFTLSTRCCSLYPKKLSESMQDSHI